MYGVGASCLELRSLAGLGLGAGWAFEKLILKDSADPEVRSLP